MRDRVRYMFNAWYQPEYSMSTEDWLYCAYMLIGWIWSFIVGLIIGWIIV